MSKNAGTSATETIKVVKSDAESAGEMIIAVPGFKLSVPIEVRFRDTDAMGHMNNAVFLTFLEVARAHYWKFLFGTKDYKDVGFILARAEVDYRSPAYCGETLMVGLRTEKLGESSFTMRYQIRERDLGRKIADAGTVLVMYDYAARKKTTIPKTIREAIQRCEGI